MGLDMYFYAESDKFESVGRSDKEPKALDYPKGLKALGDYIYDRHFKSKTVTTSYQIGYFRKFNALHAKIVKEHAGGEDNCQKIFLYKKDVIALLDICKQVQADHGKAAELLPTQDGFFFGLTEYDEWYFQDVDEAVRLFELILDELDFERYDLIYRASW